MHGLAFATWGRLTADVHGFPVTVSPLVPFFTSLLGLSARWEILLSIILSLLCGSPETQRSCLRESCCLPHLLSFFGTTTILYCPTSNVLKIRSCMLYTFYRLFEIKIKSGSTIPLFMETLISNKISRNLPENKVLPIRIEGRFERHLRTLIVSIYFDLFKNTNRNHYVLKRDSINVGSCYLVACSSKCRKLYILHGEHRM